MEVITLGEYNRKKLDKENSIMNAEVIDTPKSDRELLFDSLDAKGISYKKNMKTSELKGLDDE